MPRVKRQLIFLWPYVEWGGAQIYCLAIMKLAKDDWDITVILPRRSGSDLISMLEDLGVRIDYIEGAFDLQPAHGLGRKLSRHRARIAVERESFRKLSRFPLRSSVIHIDFGPWQSWILFSALAFKGANIFITLHNFLGKLPPWRERIFRARMQFVSRLPGFHIFASNRDTRNKLKGWISDALWEKVPVTYTCVDRITVEAIAQESIDPSQLRRKYEIPENKFVVLTVGQFVDRKGRWVLLEAAQKASQIDNDVVFVWVSPSLPDAKDRERIAGFGLGDKFRVILSASLGAGRQDVLRFFKVADCFALPSFVEGLPIAVLEAMALGVPSISTNVYAIPEAVKHEETGLLVEAGDPDELCKAILRIKDDTALSARLSEQGRNHVLEHFDERDASQIAIRAFEESLNGK